MTIQIKRIMTLPNPLRDMSDFWISSHTMWFTEGKAMLISNAKNISLFLIVPELLVTDVVFVKLDSKSAWLFLSLIDLLNLLSIYREKLSTFSLCSLLTFHWFSVIKKNLCFNDIWSNLWSNCHSCHTFSLCIIRLRELCVKLMFLHPVDYGRKAEELLWRKVYYDVIQVIKMNKKVSGHQSYHSGCQLNINVNLCHLLFCGHYLGHILSSWSAKSSCRYSRKVKYAP